MALVPRDSGMERIEEHFMSSWRRDLWAYGMEDKANLGRKNGKLTQEGKMEEQNARTSESGSL